MQQLNLKITPEELRRFRALTERLQRHHEGQGVQITTRTTFVRALNLLEAYVTKLELDRERKR